MKKPFLWYRPGSNQRHTDFQSVALPTELRYLNSAAKVIKKFYLTNILKKIIVTV